MGWNGSKIYWRIDLGYLQINMITRQVGDFGFPTPDANEFDLAALSPSLDSLSPHSFSPSMLRISPPFLSLYLLSLSNHPLYPTSPPPLLDTFLSPCHFFVFLSIFSSFCRCRIGDSGRFFASVPSPHLSVYRFGRDFFPESSHCCNPPPPVHKHF